MELLLGNSMKIFQERRDKFEKWIRTDQGVRTAFFHKKSAQAFEPQPLKGDRIAQYKVHRVLSTPEPFIQRVPSGHLSVDFTPSDPRHTLSIPWLRTTSSGATPANSDKTGQPTTMETEEAQAIDEHHEDSRATDADDAVEDGPVYVTSSFETSSPDVDMDVASNPPTDQDKVNPTGS